MVRPHEEEACQPSKEVKDIKCLKDQKDGDKQPHVSQKRVKVSKEILKKLEIQMELLCHHLKGDKEKLPEASLETVDQEETILILKQKYTTAIEKLQNLQGQVEFLEEELRYSQQKQIELQSATYSLKEELSKLQRRYDEKVSQWESSLEALDQLMDDLQANQDALRESQQKGVHFQNLVGFLQEQMDTLKQQKLMVELDFRLYQQSHSHSDEGYLRLFKLTEQLQKCRAEQVEHLADCQKAVLEMKSKLARQDQEEDLKQSVAESHQSHLSRCSQLETEVHVMLLKEAKQESERSNMELDVQRGEVHRLQGEFRKEEEKMRSSDRENQRLSMYSLQSEDQAAVKELAAHAEEARRMEGHLKEGKLSSEGKIRSEALRLEEEVMELREKLQQAVDEQEQVGTLRSELERTRSKNANLCQEIQLVVTNVHRWITEQKASNENLMAQTKAQNKSLLILSEENQHLQEANDTLKAEMQRLKRVADEKERDLERFKAQIRDRVIEEDGRTVGTKSRVARNLHKIEDMHSRLQSNLEAISMLNQQLNVLLRENKWLRLQYEEERSMRRRLEQQFPSTSQHCSSTLLPLSLSTLPSPASGSLPSPGLPRPLRLVTGDACGIPSRGKPSGAGVDISGVVPGGERRDGLTEGGAVCTSLKGQMKLREDFDLF